MTPLKNLSLALTALTIEHTAEAGGFDMDDCIEITQSTPNGDEISVQIANECSPRGQKDFSVSTFDGETFVHFGDKDTNDPEQMAQTIQAMLKD